MLKSAKTSLTVFTFHRLVEKEDSMFPEFHTVSQFDSIVGVLKKHFTLHRLDLAMQLIKSNPALGPLGVITFDDGYIDNSELALPVLLKNNVKASFFVSTQHLNGGYMFADAIAHAFRNCHSTVDLTEFGLVKYELQSINDRINAHRAVSEALKYLPYVDRESTTTAILQSLGSKAQTHEMMSNSHVQQLASNGMEIGSHTHRHIIFKKEMSDFAREDVLQSKSILEQITQKAVTGFAYPNGKINRDFDPSTEKLIKDCGFDYAASTNPAMYVRRVNDYNISRTSVWHKTSRAFNTMLTFRGITHNLPWSKL
jgi:peptidoglycan/xylan/chitin deacetylase (PgdA/CDA1 family)